MKHTQVGKDELAHAGGTLREVSRDVARISKALVELSKTNQQEMIEDEGVYGITLPDSKIPRKDVRAVIKARRARTKFFSADLFADPVWDILLHLFQAEIGQQRVTVSAACKAAAVPPTTALRWLKTLSDQDLLIRRPDPHDGRRVFLELTRSSSAGMRGYFKATSVEPRNP